MRRLLLAGYLGGGYYIYRKVLKSVIFTNQNTFLTEQQYTQFQQSNFQKQENGQIIVGHQYNYSYTPQRERILVVGGGIIGTSTAYLLSKEHPDKDIILIEKHKDVAHETSYQNGGFVCPSLSYPWTQYQLIFSFFKSAIFGSGPYAFHPRSLLEKNLWSWFINFLVLNSSESFTQKNEQSIFKLGLLGKQILTEEIQNEIQQQTYNKSTKGTLSLYLTHEDALKQAEKSKFLLESGCQAQVLNEQEIYEREPILKLGNKKYKGAILYPIDFNADTYLLSKQLVDVAIKKYGLRVNFSSSLEGFVFKKDSDKVLGVITTSGLLLCDKVVIATGNSVKQSVNQLGARIPIVSIKGYSLDVKIPEDKPHLNYNICDDYNKAYVTQLGNSLRLSGRAEFVGYDPEIQPNNINFLVKYVQENIGDFDAKIGKMWTGFRPVSPDDVPIIGPIPFLQQSVYVNCGHGSKGLTEALGSARLISEMIRGSQCSIEPERYSLKRFYTNNW